MNELNVKKMEQLLNNEDFRAEFQNTDSQEEIVRLFQEHGVEVTMEDFQAMGEKGVALLGEKGFVNEDGELSPEMLEMVNGGGKFGTLVLLGVLAFASAWAGHPEGTIICIIAGIAYLKYGK